MKKWAFMVAFIVIVGSAVMAQSTTNETNLTFHNFPWGTSMDEVIKKMGKPVSREEISGLTSLIWENVEVNGYTTYMLCYFNKAGLQGGTYYFITYDREQLMKCYTEIRQELRDRYGPTYLFDGITKETRPYECSWNFSSGYVSLKVNTSEEVPVTLWYSSPELTKKLFGINPSTAK